MKAFILVLMALCLGLPSQAAEINFNQLPLGSASAVQANDIFPYYVASSGTTKKLKLLDLINLPNLSGFASLPSPNRFGVLLSTTNSVLSVLAPDASTNKVLMSGGTVANPSWGLLTNMNLSGTALISNSNLNFMPTQTMKANITIGSAVPTDVAFVSTNTPNSGVYRDSSGNFSAGTITATISGSTSGNTSYTPNNHGAVISGPANVMTVIAPVASSVFPLVSGGLSADPSWALLTAAGGGTGVSALSNYTDTSSGLDGIAVTGGVGAVIAMTSIAQQKSDATHNGYLAQADWATFNAKQTAGNYITALTGDVTAAGPGSVASTVAKIQGTTVAGTTGSGNVVFSTSPALVTPDIGTPSAGTLTNATGLPISTGVSGLAAGVATFLGIPTSLNLKTAVTDETGSGALVFATSPSLVTPSLGTPSAAVLTNATGLPLATGVSGTLLAANFPAMLGDVTNTAGSLTNTVAKIQGTTVAGTTGTGNVVFSASPSLTTPALGTPSAAVLSNATGLPVSTGVSGLGTGVSTFLGTPSSANLATALTDETGTGLAVFNTSPALVTPALGTPSSGVLTNTTGLPLSTGVTGVLQAANHPALTGDVTNTVSTLATTVSKIQGTTVSGTTGSGNVVFSTSPALVTPALGTPASGVLTNATGLPVSTGISGLGTGVASFLATPSSANLSTAVTDETGSGSLVFATSPTLVTPVLGTPASGTLTNATGLPISTGVSGLAAGVSAFLGTSSSANLASAVTDETGTGLLVFATNPVLTTPNLGTPSAVNLANATNVPTTALSGLGTGVATWLATPSSANLIAAVTDETGTGALVFATSPTLITPVLGTPASGTMTNVTGLPVSTGISGLGTGVATFLATPTSANLAATVTNETGTGALVFATSPALVTPNIDVATGTSLALGTPAYSDTNIVAQYTGNANSYFQNIIQNTNAGGTASADFIVSNDQGTATTFYGDLGINSSGWTGAGSLVLPNATYLYSQSGDLVLGTNTSNSLHLLTNASTTDSITITTAGAVQLPKLTASTMLALDASKNIVSVTQSSVKLDGFTGYGSSNTFDVRFTSNATTGSDLTYAASATTGDTVTINTAGVYAVTFSHSTASGTNDGACLVLNTSANTACVALANTARLGIMNIGGAVGTIGEVSVSVAWRFAAADVLRFGTQSKTTPGNTGVDQVLITRLSN